MTTYRTYVLDANVFIEAARRYYAFDIAPRFWQILIDHASSGQVFSLDHVKAELMRGKDELAKWAKNDFHESFVSTENDEVIKVRPNLLSQPKSNLLGLQMPGW